MRNEEVKDNESPYLNSSSFENVFSGAEQGEKDVENKIQDFVNESANENAFVPMMPIGKTLNEIEDSRQTQPSSPMNIGDEKSAIDASEKIMKSGDPFKMSTEINELSKIFRTKNG